MGERRALVTGGAGFIGSHLVEALLRAGWRVRVLDDYSSGREANLAAVAGSVEALRGDVRDPADVATAVAGVEVVFHQAAVPSVPRSIAQPVYTHAVNVEGTLRVLEAARRAGVRRVVYAASTAAYGNGPELPKVETMAPDPQSPYALQKYVGELYCRLYADLHGLETVALRYFNVYGPRQDPGSDYAAAIPRFAAAALAGVAPRVHGDGRQTRDFVFVEDVVRANLLAADAPDASGAVCNVGSGRRTSLLELLEEIGRQSGSALVARHGPARDGDVRDSQACLEHAAVLLGYAPSISLSEGLRLTLAHLDKEASGS